MKNKGAFIAILIAAFLGIGLTLAYYSYDNKYISLTNLYKAQVQNNQAVYDEVWKVVKQQAKVSDEYAENFKKIYVDLMEARNYGGESFKWIQEQNPNFDQSMYKQLMNTIASQRANFTTAQKKMIAYHMEIENLVQMFPSRIFLGGREVPKLELVTSSKTQETFRTGKEDDVEVFDKK